MKFNPLLNKITLVLISLLVCQIFTVTLHKSRTQIMSANREDNKDKASASPAPAEDKKKEAPAATGGDAKAAAPAQGAAGGDQPSNTLGQPKIGSLLKTAPYNLTSCDQIMELEGKTVEFDDYSKKSERKFYLSAYFVSELNKTEGNKLVKSIPLADVKIAPALVKGAPNCVLFTSKLENLIMCLKDEKDVNSVLENYAKFMKCREGKQLVDPNVKQINITKILTEPYFGLTVDVEKSNITDTAVAQQSFERAFENTMERLRKIEEDKRRGIKN